MSTNEEWLARTTEETLDPDLPICDAHHHMWPIRKSGIEPRYAIEEFLQDTGSGHNVRSSVFVTAGHNFRIDGPKHLRCIGEIEYVNGQASISAAGEFSPTRVAAAQVGTAYLRDGAAVAEVLDALIAVGGGRVRGVRESATWHASPDVPNHRSGPPEKMLRDARFREGFAQLAPRRLSYEAWVFHTQLDDVIDLAQHFPETTIIVNHFGGPLGIGPYVGKRDEVLADWRKSIDGLAQCPNIVFKLGGMQMEWAGHHWSKQSAPPSSQKLMQVTQPFFEHAVAAFGAERCMFESNFPADKISVSYNVLWNAYKRLAAGCTAEERANLFHDTAARVYRLAESGQLTASGAA